MPPALPWVAAGFGGAVGLLVGSFLNVVAFRLPRNCMSIVRPRSRCTSCLTPIAWFDNVPVLSWLVLGGRCRQCKERISLRYPAVELFTGALFFFVAWRAFISAGQDPRAPLSWLPVVTSWAILGGTIACSLIDWDWFIIPDEITKPLLALGLVVGSAYPEWHGGELPAMVANLKTPYAAYLAGAFASAFGAFVGGGAIYVAGVLGKLAFKKEAMGGGDVVYMAMWGTYIGWKGALLAIVIACFVGSFYGVGRMWVKKDHYLPFGPFLSIGCATMLLFGDRVYAFLRWYLQPLGNA